MSAILSISLDSVKRLTGLQPIKLSAEESARLQAQLKEIRELAYRRPSGPPPGVYAEVKVNGKVVATTYNDGSAVTSNALGAKLRSLPSMGPDDPGTGPELAARRAREIAAALGGTVVKAETALTPAEWRARPPMTWTVDYEAMARDERAAAASRETAATLVRAQLEGQAQGDA